jgi:hypothetical protein
MARIGLLGIVSIVGGSRIDVVGGIVSAGRPSGRIGATGLCGGRLSRT